ncbi:MAG: GGDEF domain-containing protein [Raoultibacter sp.]
MSLQGQRYRCGALTLEKRIETNQELSDLLMGFLENLIYHPEKAVLDTAVLPPDLQHLGEGLQFLAACVQEQKVFGKDLMRGNLDAKPPAVDNVLAAPLKEIQGALRHVRWQAQQVTKGDYTQRIDFMGDFSDAFNAMTQQLKEREERLLAERQVVEAQNKDLDDMNTLVMEMTLDDARFIVLIDEASGQFIFETKTAQAFARSHPVLKESFRKHLITCAEEVKTHPLTWEYDPSVDPSSQVNRPLHFSITSHRIRWKNAYAIAHLIVEDTQVLEEQDRMREFAFRDALTGLYNRRYGMGVMAKLHDEHQSFALAFIDIDYLKYCNDEFGHDEGDEYLVALAELLGKVSRPRELCRIGGDEFLVVKPGCTEKELENVLFALREEFAQQEVPKGYRFKRSFSFGIQEVAADSSLSTSVSLEEADQKMYEFKRAHRKSLARVLAP